MKVVAITLRFVRLLSAFWLIIDIVLDGVQAPKYMKLSPKIYGGHEGNLNLTNRMMDFCLKLEQISFNETNELYHEWMNRCQNSDFSFTNSYGLDEGQLESIRVLNYLPYLRE